MFVHILALTLSLTSLSTQQKDPLKDFCRLFGHQTTVVDRNLYIDGGLVNWSPVTAGSTNYTSSWLREAQLDINNQGFPQEVTLEKKPTVPSVSGGVLWADQTNKLVYFYGGEYGDGKPDDFKLWFYDIVYKTWNVSNASVSTTLRAAWGAGVAVEDKATGYYYGGWLTNNSVPGYASRTPLANMLIYDMEANRFSNQTGPDEIPRAEGAMVYLPAGDRGLLVYFGGIEVTGANSSVQGVPMNKIFIFDIANNLWYQQNATGDVPEMRRRFCAGATWAKDRSSYNIYLYGGASVGNGVGFGDVYILSLPSFTWIKFFPRPEDGAGPVAPHHSTTCNVIGGSQMIVMGGHFTNQSDCDIPAVYGMHGLSLGKDNANNAKWAAFNPNLTTYRVPDEIVKTIGGGATGAATLTVPTGGFQDRDLNVAFIRAYTPAMRTPTRYIPPSTGISNPTSHTNRKAVIGGAIGGSLGAIALVATISACVFIYRKGKANVPENMPPAIEKGHENRRERRVSELPASGQAAEGLGIWSPTVYTSPSPHNSPQPPAWVRTGSGARHHRSPSDKTTLSCYYPHPQKPVAPTYAVELPAPEAQEMPVPSPTVPKNGQRQSLSLEPYFAQNPPREPATRAPTRHTSTGGTSMYVGSPTPFSAVAESSTNGRQRESNTTLSPLGSSV